jgi:hypothetical protein
MSGLQIEKIYTNLYFHCNVLWEDEWDSMCNDECPVCKAEIEPYASISLKDSITVIHAPEVLAQARKVTAWARAKR